MGSMKVYFDFIEEEEKQTYQTSEYQYNVQNRLACMQAYSVTVKRGGKLYT